MQFLCESAGPASSALAVPLLGFQNGFIDSVSLLSAGEAQSQPRHLGWITFKECRCDGLCDKLLASALKFNERFLSYPSEITGCSHVVQAGRCRCTNHPDSALFLQMLSSTKIACVTVCSLWAFSSYFLPFHSWHRGVIYSVLYVIPITSINNPVTPKESQVLLNKLYQVWCM